jgi:molybdopterin adenylyltransferase
MHALERWRDVLLADDQAQTEFLDKYPSTDAQQLRQLVRGARAEVGADKPPRSPVNSSSSSKRPSPPTTLPAIPQTMNPSPVSETSAADPVRIGLVSISDRASTGIYQDKGLPALRDWLGHALLNPVSFVERLIPDDRLQIANTLCELVDSEHCDLVLTTGGTGPAPRDVTPEATLDVADKEMPGFGEQMRRISLHFVPTAILSRQTAVIRAKTLIINLPGQPKSIAETLEGVRDAAGQSVVPGLFAAVPYCVDLIGGPYLETDPAVCVAFRPKSAQRPPGFRNRSHHLAFCGHNKRRPFALCSKCTTTGDLQCTR